MQNESTGVWIALIVMAFMTVFATCATAQDFMIADLHPNFDSRTREYLNAEQDCSVIAFAIAADIPYHKSFRFHYNYAGRTNPQEGVTLGQLMDGWDMMLRKAHQTCTYYTPNGYITVGDLAILYPEGNFYVMVPGHALAIVNGTVWDNYSNRAMSAEVLGFIQLMEIDCD